jgi:hypothetical protein
MPAILESRIGEVVDRAEALTQVVVDKVTTDIEAAAKANLVAQGSVDDGLLLNSVEGTAEGYSGEINVGAYYAMYVELGTGVRGAHYEFPGKPQGIDYDMEWERGIPKGRGFAFLIPAVEEAREPFELALGQVFR